MSVAYVPYLALEGGTGKALQVPVLWFALISLHLNTTTVLVGEARTRPFLAAAGVGLSCGWLASGFKIRTCCVAGGVDAQPCGVVGSLHCTKKNPATTNELKRSEAD